MAIIDVVKCEVNDEELIYKFPSDDLRIGTQLVVYPTQTAFFVKGGKIFDSFESGTYTIKTNNIPILNKVVNIPFGFESPFKAEVWFVNQIAILDSKWGTTNPIQIEDPKYNIIVPVRAFGQYGFTISEPRKFLEKMVGNMTSFTVDKVNQYFKGLVMSVIVNIISDKMTIDNISILNINSHLTEISNFCKEKIQTYFENYGIGVDNFYVMSINVPENDPSFVRLKAAKDLTARLKITGSDVYQMERSFDVLEAAAVNESGSNNLINAGIGLGAGLNIGNQVGSMVSNTFNTNPKTPPPLPQGMQYFIAVNGQHQGPFEFTVIETLINENKILSDTLIWKQGQSEWVRISLMKEFISYFKVNPPTIPTV